MARMFTNLLRIYTNESKKGQALVELAVFGTVLIFCLTLLLRYGMSANYQQRVDMQTFRKAFVRAKTGTPVGRGPSFDPGWTFENSSPPTPTEHSCYVSYTVIEDKPVFSASGILPIAERSPVASAAQAVWSIDLFAEADGEADEPRAEFEINGRRYSFIGDKLDLEDGDGGLQGYDKNSRVNNSSFQRQENTSDITTTDYINTQEQFKRVIKTKDGDYNVPTDTFSTRKTETWYTPNE